MLPPNSCRRFGGPRKISRHAPESLCYISRVIKKHLVLIAISSALAGGCADKSVSSGTAGVKPYPLTTCVVSGEKLGAMGDPVVFVHNGQEIKLCCKNCRADFDKDPGKFMAKLAAK